MFASRGKELRPRLFEMFLPIPNVHSSQGGKLMVDSAAPLIGLTFLVYHRSSRSDPPRPTCLERSKYIQMPGEQEACDAFPEFFLTILGRPFWSNLPTRTKSLCLSLFWHQPGSLGRGIPLMLHPTKKLCSWMSCSWMSIFPRSPPPLASSPGCLALHSASWHSWASRKAITMTRKSVSN